MVELTEIKNYLEEKFPPSYKEDFDNIGLLLGREKKEVSKVLVCLDFSKKVCEEALNMGASLIITHHPVIFSPIKSLTDASLYGDSLIYALENNISVYSAHTNLDSSPMGLTEYVCSLLELVPYGNIEGNLGRMCMPQKDISAKELCEKIKRVFNVENIFTTFTKDRKINKIALCNGGGGSLSGIVQKSEADVYISGDLKHHEMLAFSQSKDIDYIEIRHHDFEFPVTELLKKTLEEKFKDKLEVKISREDPSPLIDSKNII